MQTISCSRIDSCRWDVFVLLTAPAPESTVRDSVGAIAQLGERLHGMQEVGGSIPPSSTKYQWK